MEKTKIQLTDPLSNSLKKAINERIAGGHKISLTLEYVPGEDGDGEADLRVEGDGCPVEVIAFMIHSLIKGSPEIARFGKMIAIAEMVVGDSGDGEPDLDDLLNGTGVN